MSKKCPGECERALSIRQQPVSSWQERVQKTTGQKVTISSYGLRSFAAGGPPDRVTLADGNEALRTLVSQAYYDEQSDLEARTDALSELCDGCPGLIDAVVTIDERSVTVQVCGRSALEAAANMEKSPL